LPNNVVKAVVKPGSGELCLPREDGLDTSYVDLVTPNPVIPRATL